jgi:hypothetical protein
MPATKTVELKPDQLLNEIESLVKSSGSVKNSFTLSSLQKFLVSGGVQANTEDMAEALFIYWQKSTS